MSTKKQSHQSAGSTMHHAYRGIGTTANQDAILAFLESHFAITIQHGSNTHIFSFAQCGVDDVRDVIERAYMKPVGGGDAYIVLIADAITTEAQNALLKVLEEPPAQVHLFIITAPQQFILPTIHSRTLALPTILVENEDALKEARKFLSATIPERLVLVAELLETEEKQQVHNLLSALEHVLEASLHAAKGDKVFAIARKIQIIEDTRKDLAMTGAMQKILLESVALLV